MSYPSKMTAPAFPYEVSPLSPWRLVLLAHDLTVPKWSDLGLESPTSLKETSDVPEERLVHGLVALLLIRIIALVRSRTMKAAIATPLRASQIVIMKSSISMGLAERPSDLPPDITPLVCAQLYQFVSTIASGYRCSPKYHNLDHAFHVTVCCNKLLNTLIQNSLRAADEYVTNSSSVDLATLDAYGMASDSLAQLALIFSATIHDVDHQGITNQQLVLEGDDLALMYNDQSVAEQRSISLAFSELMRAQQPATSSSPTTSTTVPIDDESRFVYGALRTVIFGNCSTTSKSFISFRRMVIDLVLTTDIASPERVQIVKSKYKEAFGANSSASAVLTPHSSSTSKPFPNNRSSRNTKKSVFVNPRNGSLFLSSSVTSEASELGSLLEEDRLEDVSEELRNSLAGRTKMRKKSLLEEFLKTRKSACLTIGSDTSSSEDGVQHSSPPLSSSSAEEEKLVAVGMQRNNSFGNKSMVIKAPAVKSSRKRRFSAPVFKSTYECRLGILRALNLTGSTVTLFSSPFSSQENEERQLKVSVLMELMLKCADVSSIMQGWEVYRIWSKRLFMEMAEAFNSGRGVDPRPGWFENQITFLDSYATLLAKHLNEVKVFGDLIEEVTENIQIIRKRWLEEGRDIVDEYIKESILDQLAEDVSKYVHLSSEES
jgi:hypothetical protein